MLDVYIGAVQRRVDCGVRSVRCRIDDQHAFFGGCRDMRGVCCWAVQPCVYCGLQGLRGWLGDGQLGEHGGDDMHCMCIGSVQCLIGNRMCGVRRGPVSGQCCTVCVHDVRRWLSHRHSSRDWCCELHAMRVGAVQLII